MQFVLVPKTMLLKSFVSFNYINIGLCKIYLMTKFSQSVVKLSDTAFYVSQLIFGNIHDTVYFIILYSIKHWWHKTLVNQQNIALAKELGESPSSEIKQKLGCLMQYSSLS